MGGGQGSTYAARNAAETGSIQEESTGMNRKQRARRPNTKIEGPVLAETGPTFSSFGSSCPNKRQNYISVKRSMNSL